MTDKQLLEVLEFGIKQLRSRDVNNPFTLLEYYAFTDVRPKELAKTADKLGCRSIGTCLREYDDLNIGHFVTLKMEEKINNFHSIGGHTVTKEDKMFVKNIIENEGYSLIDGVYHAAVFHYFKHGLPSISKSNAKARVLESYYEFKEHQKSESNVTSKAKLMIKA